MLWLLRGFCELVLDVVVVILSDDVVVLWLIWLFGVFMGLGEFLVYYFEKFGVFVDFFMSLFGV